MFYDRDGISIHHGDALDVLPTFEANSLDAVICDPPYGLGFMGRAWDHGVPSVDVWRDVLRVAKPGAFILAFGGTRMFHRLAVAIEDAGFEIRDTIGWIYGSGFPKSLDVSKAIDKAAGAEREVVGTKHGLPGYSLTDGMAGGVAMSGNVDGSLRDGAAECAVTAPATDAARRWSGWGTALKPAWEPIIVARKPLVGTVAANVLAYGTGALNLNACRIEAGDGDYNHPGNLEKRPMARTTHQAAEQGASKVTQAPPSDLGRWPANLIHDGSPDVLAGFPQTGVGAGGRTGPSRRDSQTGYRFTWRNAAGFADSGSAARFFYCAKAGTSERWSFCRICGAAFYPQARSEHRHGNPGGDHLFSHPTQKPLDLMKYLVTLAVQPGGTVLDPFMGTGTTLIAAGAAGFRAVGIERDVESCSIAVGRLALPLEF
jgi:site-specific DNA-methyltransferase (adenine-specific)